MDGRGFLRRLSRVALAACGAAAGVALLGCPSSALLETARTVPRGVHRFGIGVDYDGVGVGRQPASGGQLEIGWRTGLGDRTDVGGRLSMLGVEGVLKYQLVRGDAIDLAVEPSIGGSVSQSGVLGFLHVTVPVGWNAAEGIVVVLAPRFGGLLGGNTGIACSNDALCLYASHGIEVGGSLGVALQLGAHTWLMPEANLLGFVYGDGLAPYQRYLFSAGIGVLYDWVSADAAAARGGN